jgi:hypothetical protein
LLVQPPKKFLKALVGENFFHGIKIIAEFVVRPGLVDKIFAGTARGRYFASALAARHHVMSARGDVSIAKDAGLIHAMCSGS